MAKAAAAAAQAPTDDEKEVLFGGVDAETLAGMTDEERAGIEGGDVEDTGDEEAEAGDEQAEGEGTEGDAEGEAEDDAEGDDAGEDGEDAEGDDAGGEEGEGEGEEADADAEDGADAGGEEAGEGEQAEDDEDDPLDITRSIMPNEWQLPKDADEQLKGLDQQAADLADKFDSGDLTAREYHQQSQAITDQRSTLRTQINDAKKSWGKAVSDWSNRTVRGFLREHPEYDPEKNPTLNRMLDGEVRALQEGTPDLFNPRILRQAHANIQKAMGKTVEQRNGGKVPNGKVPPNGKGKNKQPVVPGKRAPVPPTLARVPQDQVEDTEGGKFARLDRLASRKPEALEDALSRMSPEDQEAYLRGA